MSLRDKAHTEQSKVAFAEGKEKQMKIKRCPHCGKKKPLKVMTSLELSDRDTGMFAVCCAYNSKGCGASGGFNNTKKEAIFAWNFGYRED